MNKEQFQNYVAVIAVLGSLYLYIQAFKIFKTGETAGVSELAFVLTLISSILWLIYGIIVKDKVIYISAISGIIGSLLVLFLLVKYRDTEPKPRIEFQENNRNPEDIIEAYTNRLESKRWLFVMNETFNKIFLNSEKWTCH